MKTMSRVLMLVLLGFTMNFAQITAISPPDGFVGYAAKYGSINLGFTVGAAIPDTMNFELSTDSLFASQISLPQVEMLYSAPTLPGEWRASFPMYLDYSTKYYWRVSLRNGLVTTYSNTFTFTTNSLPTLVSPLGLTNVSVTPTLTWTELAQGPEFSSYTVFVDDDSLFGSPVDITDSITGLSHYVSTPLSYGTKYYWMVTEEGDLGTIGGSDTASFTTMVAHVAPTLTAPVANATGVSLIPTFTWTAGSGPAPATGYRFELATDTLFSVKYADTTSLALTFTYTHLAPSAPYYWRVTRIDSLGSATSPRRMFTTAFNFALNAPAANATGVSLKPTFTWTDGTGVVPNIGYRLELASDSLFATKLADTTTSALTYTYSSYLTPSTPYYWRVTWNDTLGLATTAFRKFTTIPPITSVPYYPISNSEVFSSPVALSWGQTGTYVWTAKYDVQYSLDSTFATYTQIFTNVANPTVFFNYTGLPGDVPVYWRVISKTSDGIPTHVSPLGSFVIKMAGYSALTPVTSYPNGGAVVSSGNQTFYWYLNGSGAGLRYDFQLSTSNTFATGTVDSNLTATSIAKSGLADGTYYWRVRSKTVTNTYSAWSDTASFTVTTTASVAAAPVPSWPVGGALVYSLSPQLYWYLNSAASGLTFEVKYGTTPSMTTTVDSISGQSLILSGLTAGSTYYWSVRSYNGSSFSPWSAVDSFATYSPAPTVSATAPVPGWPTGGEIVWSLTPTISWWLNGSSTGLTFSVTVAKDTAFTVGVVNLTGLTTTSTTLAALTNGTTYFWRVRSTDGITPSAWSTTATFTTVSSGGTEVPILSWPIGGTTVWGTSQGFSWYLNSSPVGKSYQYQLDTLNTFATKFTSAVLTTNSATNSSLLPGKIYYWRARTIAGTDTSAWSAAESFVTYASSGAITPIAATPDNGVIVPASAPVLGWFVPTDASKTSGYELEYSNSASFVSSTKVTGLTTNQHPINGLVAGAPVYWRVRSVGNDGSVSNFSETSSFLPSGAVSNETGFIPTAFNLEQNYPNPFNPSTTIRFSLPEASIVTVKVYNMLGQEVRTLISSELAAGEHTIVWNGDNSFGQVVATGAYLYRITAGSFTSTKKMLFAK